MSRRWWRRTGRWDIGLDPDDVRRICLERDGVVLNEDADTLVLHHRDLVFKRSTERFATRLRRLGQTPPLVREHAALLRLSELGLRTVEPRGVAVSFGAGRWIVGEEILVTTFAAGLTSLGYARRRGVPPGRRVLVAALTRLAVDLRRVHRCGLFVNTLFDRNVLIGEPEEYALVDVGKTGRRGSEVFDLASLDKGLEILLSRSDRLRLLETYLGSYGPPPLDLATAVGRARASLARRGAAASWCRLRHTVLPRSSRLISGTRDS